jgi:DNA-binding XRE family transcriptional regulator
MVICMRRAKRYKRKPFKPINCDDFKELRLMNRLSIQDTAKLLHVTSRTVSLWEAGSSRIPYAAFKLLRCLAMVRFCQMLGTAGKSRAMRCGRLLVGLSVSMNSPIYRTTSRWHVIGSKIANQDNLVVCLPVKLLFKCL